ncbi:MAG TPA: DUF1553 domain-containing protein [Gemmataceae bacterium]|jgi:hypothetical protein
MRRFLLLIGLAVLPARPSAAETVDYLREVKPVLKQRCFACHGSLKQKAKLRLDAAALLRKGGRHGPAVKPADAAGSLLIERISDAEDSTRMPPQGKPLTATQIALIKAWIDQGALAPPGEKPEEDPRAHWAFQKPVRPALPIGPHSAGTRNPVDVFLAAARAKKGVTASRPADRPTLLRRLYLDLIGLPPSRAQLQAFLADPAPDAYEKVVDSLLASPQYGERWARHWMDVWRYSDWYGRRSVPDVMNSYPRIWRWRDWIVRSLNEDCGYDRMIVEMLAADEISPDDEDSLAATGFLVRNWFKWNYNQWMRDNVEHTGKAFLGLTFNCCHCHDHKYDPIAQEEYFRFRAFFEPLELRHDRVAGEPDPGPFKKYVYGVAYGPIAGGRIRVFDEKLDAQTFFYSGGDERNRVAGKPPVVPGAPAALGGDRLKIEPVNLPPQAWYPGLRPFVQREETERRQAAVAAAEASLGSARKTLAEAERLLAEARGAVSANKPPPVVADQMAKRARAIAEAQRTVRLDEARLTVARSDLDCVQARITADKIIHLGANGDAKASSRAASRAERQYNLDVALVAAIQAEIALDRARQIPAPAAQTQALEKQLSSAQTKVAACRKALDSDSTSYTPLSPVYPRTSTGRRTALARWIASKDNPLTARVAVNHVWNWHFGRPFVETTYNFGRSGAQPSHPELLDFLAVELMANGWRLKPLHRLIVTSEAYRQSSSIADSTGNPQSVDPENRLLWRFPPRRMEAEEVRDSLLFVAGELDTAMGGPEVPHEQGQSSRRRSLYFAHHGESKMEFLELFDGANACEAYRRSTSVLPQQALALSNSELELRQGRLLARKLWGAARDEPTFIRTTFEQVLGRLPSAAELRASTAFLARQTRLFEQQKKEIEAASKVAGSDGPSPEPDVRARENLIHALLNHNDFVTVR